MATKALRTQDDVYRLLLPKDRGEVVYFDEGKDRERVSGLALRSVPPDHASGSTSIDGAVDSRSSQSGPHLTIR